MKELPKVREKALEIALELDYLSTEDDYAKSRQFTMRAAGKLSKIVTDEVLARTLFELTQALSKEEQLEALTGAWEKRSARG